MELNCPRFFAILILVYDLVPEGGAVDGWYKAFEYVTWVFQLGFSMLFPLVCCLAGCWWLTARMGVGLWVYAPGLVLGLVLGGYSFAGFVRYWTRRQDKEDAAAKAPRRSGFNGH